MDSRQMPASKLSTADCFGNKGLPKIEGFSFLKTRFIGELLMIGLRCLKFYAPIQIMFSIHLQLI